MMKFRRIFSVAIMISMLAAYFALPASADAATDNALYNFESGTQSFFVDGGAANGTVAKSSEQAFAGASSLKVNFNVPIGSASKGINVGVANPNLIIGATYAMHVYIPSGANIKAMLPYVMDNTWSWVNSYYDVAPMVKDGWNTVKLTIPAKQGNGTTDYKTPLNQVGIQFLVDTGGYTGSAYIDSITLESVPVAPPSPASLSSLKIDGAPVIGFDANKTAYVAHVPNDAASAAVTAAAVDPAASVSISGDGSLAVGENNVAVTVTAPTETKVYTVKVIRGLPANQGNRISIQGREFYANHERIWFNGANTPWDKWNDFGGAFNYAFWDTHFQQLHDNGVNASRVWITSNGEVGIDIDENGHVAGATAAHWNDLDSLFYLAQKHGVYIMATLMSFDHMKDSHPNYTSWRNMLASDANIDSYVNNYVIPFVNRYKANPYLWSIDFMNEPDWVYEDAHDGNFPWERLQTLFAKESVAVHTNSQVLTTAGLAMVKYNSDTCDPVTKGCKGNMVGDAPLMAAAGGNPLAKLDFWSGHYYDWMGQYWGNPLYTTPALFGMTDDRPSVIGETAAIGTQGHTLTDDIASAYENGWQGIFPWTSNGVDGLGNLTNVGPAASAFRDAHPELVFPVGLAHDANLSDLQVDGATVAGFAADTPSYSVEVPNSTTSVDVFAAVEEAHATVAVTGGVDLTVGDQNTVTLVVTAEDGVTTKTYTITIKRAKSSNANLSDLKVNGATLDGFSADTHSYSMLVPLGTASVAVTATAADDKAIFAVTGGTKLVNGENTVTVVVTAEDGTKQTYTITVNRAKSSNALLNDLKVNGQTIAGFASGSFNYTLDVPNGTTLVTVTAAVSDPKARKVSVRNDNKLVVGANEITVRVTAEDGTKQYYTIIVNRAKSSNASLSGLKVGGKAVEGFAPDQFAYTVQAASNAKSAKVSAAAADKTASVIIIGANKLMDGDNPYTVLVIAQDGTRLTYTVHVVRAPSVPKK
ncbi:cadherin-like beta sandwich domain-containing protein [Paenibacillus rhizovicinus]|uniref:Cadherin-like beta sandwich domain-containing protein n=1 Tax=Paenibacillus rhizovicinus TaxID=2704463 RepID=A0A6C0NYY1_9BACL|nr:cadherin-like beta sandwich domain-containing protein [Paenibacillus rhizovicinus]QHW31445.1 cadherin-like beta sandwich domain-containing protein [Paenibacillus rhizovicinus]